MSWQATNGKFFPSRMQRDKYERSLEELGKAPGGPTHIQALQDHGPVSEVTLTREGNGRHRITAKHKDGTTSTSVHPDAQRAHGIMADYLGIQPPPSQNVHRAARAHPAGPGEKARLDREDSRVSEGTEQPA